VRVEQILGNLGTTVAPRMLFFQQSRVVDKGLTVRDIRVGQMDTALGGILMGWWPATCCKIPLPRRADRFPVGYKDESRAI